jgi:DNA-binding transcriptional ArsR family regulator
MAPQIRFGVPGPSRAERDDVAIELESYRHLDPEQARAFRLLSVPDGQGISIAAAAAMLDLPEPAAQALLESLAEVHLVEADVQGRYRCHPAVRRFARHRAAVEDGSPAGRAALERLLCFYQASVENSLFPMDSVTLSAQRSGGGHGLIFDTRHAAAAWLLLERDRISATTRQASAQLWDPSPNAAEALRYLTPLARRFDTDASHPSFREIYHVTRSR